MSSFIKILIRAKDSFYKKLVHKSNNMYHICAFKNLQNQLNQSIQIANQNYVKKITQRLGDPNASSKWYWPLFKILLNRNKIPFFLPLFHDDKYIVDFHEKSEIVIFFLLKHVLRFQTEAFYLLNYHCVQIAHYFPATLQKMAYFK